jgi:hypothetical protein
LIKKFYKAALKYDKWKSKNNPDHKPWLNPEQISVPRLDWKDISAFDVSGLQNNVDESQINENEVDKNDLDEEN